MAAYSDAEGWHNKQFLGGEFTLGGNYDVSITVPENHVVASTGTENPSEVLTSDQRSRLRKAKDADRPMYVITPEEAAANEKTEAKKFKTWVFKAEQVRDFAFATSPKFVWDAQGVESGGQTVMAMSYYPLAGMPLWEKYSTHAIVHTIEQYNKYTFDYPYPTAISVNGPVGGMEYPMITFNGPRPELNKRLVRRPILAALNTDWFPLLFMRLVMSTSQWLLIAMKDSGPGWMRGSIPLFEFLAEQAWEENYPSRRGEARNIIEYMASSEQVPIMTNSESLWQFGNNAYGKPATALNVLRETILGRELFDFAFQEYARRWKFKRPMPADFFRTMEDASGVDLDWFWRGWFYSTDHVDISLEEVHHFTLNTKNMELERAYQKEQKMAEPESITKQRNRGLDRRIERYPELADFYNEYDEFTVTGKIEKSFEDLVKKLKPREIEALKTKNHFYQFEFANKGGLVMPIILQLEYESGKQNWFVFRLKSAEES